MGPAAKQAARRRARRFAWPALALICLVAAGIALQRVPAIGRRLFGGSSANAPVARGKAVFDRSCSSGYCHGPNGAGAGAPRLTNRGFDAAYIGRVVTAGISGTAMPAFGGELANADLNAVIAYVASVNGVSGSDNDATPARLSANERRGRAFFSDAVRGFGRCSTCHEAGGIGIPVAAAISRVPGNARALRSIATPNVVALRLGGESIPALMVSDGREAIFYDLTTPPPVLRRVDPNLVSLAGRSHWNHASVIGSYSDAELDSVLAYLKAAEGR